ncbi:MAG: LysM peptidoglycan-binding domain-containing protein [Propionibacteriaceae bacterium]|jgi:LysM repeat protein/GH25 family lysozyme M1 (1,4-beta-N-acetylmuramidase)|nr:LysM peptidoglycan-binding domain-containing protein [Propionibacteriaceae bacterium]
MLKGIDVSYWQQSTPLWAAPDFVIARAGYGTTVDPMCDIHYQAAKRAGKLRGVYWYGEPNAAGSDAIQEADSFVDAIQGYLGEATLWLDFEAQLNGIWGQQAKERDWVKTFIQRVHSRTNVWAGLYVQGSAAARVYPAVAESSPLWLANWGRLDANGKQVTDLYPEAIAQGFPAYPWPLTIWQFTSEYEEVSLDANLFNGDTQAWHKLALGDRSSSGGNQPPAPLPPSTSPEPAPAGTYVVIPGDNLSTIAAKHGVTLAQLKAWNPALFDAAHNGGNLIHAGERVHVGTNNDPGTPTSRVHVVAPGDNLSAIAAKYGTTWPVLAQLNGLSKPDLIHPGQIIKLP